MHRYIGKDKNGHVVRGTGGDLVKHPLYGKGYWIKCQDCGELGQVKVMDTEKNDTKCGGRCTQATNSKCHCECAGENHGAGRVSFA